MVTVGNWMRNKETGEAFKIKAIGAALIKYGNDNGDGEVRADELTEHFDVLDVPTERTDIEFLMKAKIEAGEAETGLYDLGISYVVADLVSDGKGGETLVFQWFTHAMSLADILND